MKNEPGHRCTLLAQSHGAAPGSLQRTEQPQTSRRGTWHSTLALCSQIETVPRVTGVCENVADE